MISLNKNVSFFFFQGDLNTGGIVAGVLVALLLLVLLIVAVWFAKKKGYLDSKFHAFSLNTF